MVRRTYTNKNTNAKQRHKHKHKHYTAKKSQTLTIHTAHTTTHCRFHYIFWGNKCIISRTISRTSSCMISREKIPWEKSVATSSNKKSSLCSKRDKLLIEQCPSCAGAQNTRAAGCRHYMVRTPSKEGPYAADPAGPPPGERETLNPKPQTLNLERERS